MASVRVTCPACQRVFVAATPQSRCPACGANLGATPDLPAVSLWYCEQGRQKTGPHSFPQLQSLVGAGQLLPSDMVWQEGSAGWVTAASVPGLFAAPTRAVARAWQSSLSWLIVALGVTAAVGLGVLALVIHAGRAPVDRPQVAGNVPPVEKEDQADLAQQDLRRQSDEGVIPARGREQAGPAGEVITPAGPASVPLLPAPREGVVQTFVLKETFGVSHPQQVVTLNCNYTIDPERTVLLGPDGSPKPYQLLRDGRIAVLTDLPAKAERTWKLVAGRVPVTAEGGVTVREGKAICEIANGLTGVRVPLPSAELHLPPAPIQGIRYRDGYWTATEPTFLTSSSGTPLTGMAMEVRFLERGPLRTIVEVSYRFARPDLKDHGQLLLPGGAGFYRSTLTLDAGQPSILVEEDTDMDLAYSLDLTDGLYPDQARYRGHHSSAVAYGREPDGQIYRPADQRTALDAVVDLPTDRSVTVGYRASTTMRPPLVVWDHWAEDTGYYWMLYNTHAPATGNVAGIFAGPSARALGAGSSGVGIFSSPDADGQLIAGLTVATHRRSPDGHVAPRVRFAWGLFAGTKESDLLPPDQIQPINRQMNLHGGINLDKVQHYPADFTDPATGYGALYLERATRDRLVERVRSDSAYYDALSAADPSFRPILDTWRDPTGAKLRDAVGQITSVAHDVLDSLVNGGGAQDYQVHYDTGGLAIGQIGVWIDQVLADERLTANERAEVKAAAGLFASVLWDDDFVPLFNGHGLNLGKSPRPLLAQSHRDFYALLMSAEPAWKERAAQVQERTLAALETLINDAGAANGSPHSIQETLAPMVGTLLQLRLRGRDDPFRMPMLAKFAEFYLNLLTTPEARFGGSRKVMSVGDSSVEGSALFGLLASGFRTANPALSARLMGAWVSQGKPHSASFGSTVLMIDDHAPAVDPALESAALDGYYTVLRSDWGTKNETAVWLLNGDFYSDHRHNDRGEVVIYALGAPLALDWGSRSSPRASGAMMKNVLLPEGEMGHRWDQDSPPLDAGAFWKSSAQQAFLSFRESSLARAIMTSPTAAWTRSVYLIHPVQDCPIIMIRDHCTGEGAPPGKVSTLNLMAEGSVDTPAGTVSPQARSYQSGKQLPSAGPGIPLAPGVNRLGFSGQLQIDWDLFTISDQDQQVRIGNWSHNCHPATEMNEFMRALQRPFEERQHILRILGSGPFQVLILPYHKGKRRDDVQVKQNDTETVITSGKAVTTLAENYYAHRDGQKQVVTAFGPERVDVDGVGIRGGPAEVVLEPRRAILTVHGEKGVRRLKLQGKWRVEGSQAGRGKITSADGEWLFDYPGGSTLTLTLVRD